MASRTSLIQSRSIYVGTSNSVAPSDGNLIVTGNVGIGTTSPAYKLDVSGQVRFDNGLSNGSGLALVIQGSGDVALADGGSLFFGAYDYGASTYIRGYDNGDIMYFHVNGTNMAYFRSDRAYFNANVGIGTASPSYKLQVNGSIWARPTSDGTSGTAIHMGRFTDIDTPAYSFITDDYNNDNLYLYSHRWGIDYKIQRASSSGTKEVFRVNGEDTNGHSARLYDASNTVAIQLSSNGNSYLNGGNVGIGTTSPQTTLHVNGEIRWGGGTAAPYVYSGIDSIGLYIEQVDNNTGKDKIRFQTRTNNTGSYTSFVIDANAQNFAFNRGDITLADGYRIWLRGSSSSSATGAQSYIYSDGLNLKIKGDDNVQLLGDGGGVILHADYTGNVGIGTTSPASKLQIGSVGSTGYSVGNGLAFGDGTRAAALNVESSGLNIYSSSHIKLSPNTTEKVRITTDGNVGIGTTAPTSVLDIRRDGGGSSNPIPLTSWYGGNGGGNLVAKLEYTADAGIFSIGYAGISSWDSIVLDGGASNSGSNISLKNDATTTVFLRSSNGNNYINSGNVGIGTTSPDARLHVASGKVAVDNTSSSTDVRYGGSLLALANSYSALDNIAAIDFPQSAAGSGFSRIGVQYKSRTASQETQDMFFVTMYGGTSSEKMRITSTGNVGIGTASPSGSGWDESSRILHIYQNNTSGALLRLQSGNATTILNAGDNQFSLFTTSASDIRLGTGGSERMRITSSGNVGINVTAPTHKLHVNGTTYFYEFGGAHLTNYAYSTYQFDSLATSSSSTSGGSLGAIMKLTSSATSATGTFNAIRTRAYAENTTVNTDWLINYWAEYRNYTSTSAVTLNNHAAFSISPLSVGGSATVTNNYGIYLDTGATATNNYGVYQIGSTVKNYFAGNVGIGDSNPTMKLKVVDSTSGVVSAFTNSSSAGSGVQITGGSGTNPILQLRDYAGGEKVRVQGNGNVGIGVTAPDSKLHVEQGLVTLNTTNLDNGTAVGLQLTYADQDLTGGEGIGIAMGMNGRGRSYIANIHTGTNKDASTLAFYTESGGVLGERMRISEGGNVGIGRTPIAAALEVEGQIRVTGTSGYTFHAGGDTDGGMFSTADGSINFRTNGSESIRINSSGNVGIGTTSPDSKFHVEDTNPEVRITGTGGTSFPRLLWEYPVSATQASRWALTASASGNTFYLYNYTQSKKIFQVDGTASHITLNHDAAGTTQIGTSTTQTAYQLYVKTNVGQTGAIEASGAVKITSGALGVNIAASTTAGRIDASNDIVAYSTSDYRLKENIKPLENATEKVKKLTGVEFDWKQEHKDVHGYEGHDVGVIAQEVQEVLPEAIRTNDSGYLSVRYEKLIGLLIESNKELAARVEELEQKLKQ